MNINPKRVYEGFFETYFIRPFIHRYADFRGEESGRDCLLSLGAWIVMTLGIAGIMMGQVGIIGPQGGLAALFTICGLWLLASVVPLIAVVARTKNGSPLHSHRPRILGIDVLLAASCLLFFVLGLLMMVTTLNSGELNPNARAYEETDTLDMDDDYVSEEPIFSYQTDISETETSTDSISMEDLPADASDAELVNTDEDNFDPALLPVEDSIL